MIRNQPPGAAGEQPAVIAALQRLDDALDPGEFTTTLTTGPGRRPQLTVTNRHAQISDAVWADNRAYHWSWGEWIAPVTDPATAARMISVVLRALPQRVGD